MHWLPVFAILATAISIVDCNRIIQTNTKITKIRLISGWNRKARLQQIVSCCGRYRCNGLLRKNMGGRTSRNRTVIIIKKKKKRTKKPGVAGTTIAEEAATEAAKEDETTAAGGEETTAAAGEETTAAEGETTAAGGDETTVAEGEPTTLAGENSTEPTSNETLANSTLAANQTSLGNATTPAQNMTSMSSNVTTTTLITSTLNVTTTPVLSNFTITSPSTTTLNVTTTPTSTSTSTSTTTMSTSTTTTTPPPCLPYKCDKDNALLDASEFINQSLVDGHYRTTCGKTYFFSKTMKMWSEAAMECCKMNMRLLSMETLDEQMCLAKMLKGNGNEAIGDVHWTSGSDEFREGTFAWCANSSSPLSVTSDLKFANGEPNNAGGDEDCIGAKITTDAVPNNFLLSDNACTKPAKFICETYAKPCPMPTCPNVPNVTDAVKLEESKKWKANSDGVFRRACDRQYFFSKVSKTNADAQTECYKYGLTLLSIESAQELSCLAEMNTNELNSLSSFWTSYTNDGFGCENVQGWCSTKSLINSTLSLWKPNEPSNLLSDRCAQIKMDIDPAKILMDDALCSESKLFICEGNISECSPTCPAKDKYKKDVSKFNSLGQLLNVGMYGKWANGCNKTYLFGTALSSWEDAMKSCTELGMEVLSIESDTEMTCLISQNDVNPLLRFISAFWTSGSQQDCNFRYKWCSSDVNFTRTSTLWNKGQPDNTDDTQGCVNALIARDKGSIEDTGCTKNLSYICEGPQQPACTKVTCPDYNCTKDAAKVNQSLAWKGASGAFKSFCGKQYLIHKELKTWQDAHDECCKHGMKLLAIKTLVERQCLYDGFLKYNLENDAYWTSGSSDGVNCERQWAWCPNGSNFFQANAPWAAGAPSSPFSKACALWNYNSDGASSSNLEDSNCKNMKKFICEGDVPECLPQCPETVCDKDLLLFDASKKLINPNQYGVWKTACNKTYLNYKTKMNYTEAWKACCKLGMNLLSVDNSLELQCLAEWNNDALDMGYMNERWITSASSVGCENRYFFCHLTSGLDSPSVLENNTLWVNGEGKGETGDTALFIKMSVGQTVKYVDSLLSTSAFAICEGLDPR